MPFVGWSLRSDYAIPTKEPHTVHPTIYDPCTSDSGIAGYRDLCHLATRAVPCRAVPCRATRAVPCTCPCPCPCRAVPVPVPCRARARAVPVPCPCPCRAVPCRATRAVPCRAVADPCPCPCRATRAVRPVPCRAPSCADACQVPHFAQYAIPVPQHAQEYAKPPTELHTRTDDLPQA